MLKSLRCSTDVNTVEAAPDLLDSIQRFLRSAFIGVVVTAKAIVVHLLQHVPGVGLTVGDTGIVDKETEFLTAIIRDLCQDTVRRRYYLYCVLEVLMLLCSQPMNASILASDSILSGLETLMGCTREHENIIADVVYKIATGGCVESNVECTNKCSSGRCMNELMHHFLRLIHDFSVFVFL